MSNIRFKPEPTEHISFLTTLTHYKKLCKIFKEKNYTTFSSGLNQIIREYLDKNE